MNSENQIGVQAVVSLIRKAATELAMVDQNHGDFYIIGWGAHDVPGLLQHFCDSWGVKGYAETQIKKAAELLVGVTVNVPAKSGSNDGGQGFQSCSAALRFVADLIDPGADTPAAYTAPESVDTYQKSYREFSDAQDRAAAVTKMVAALRSCIDLADVTDKCVKNALWDSNPMLVYSVEPYEVRITAKSFGRFFSTLKEYAAADARLNSVHVGEQPMEISVDEGQALAYAIHAFMHRMDIVENATVTACTTDWLTISEIDTKGRYPHGQNGHFVFHICSNPDGTFRVVIGDFMTGKTMRVTLQQMAGIIKGIAAEAESVQVEFEPMIAIDECGGVRVRNGHAVEGLGIFDETGDEWPASIIGGTVYSLQVDDKDRATVDDSPIYLYPEWPECPALTVGAVPSILDVTAAQDHAVVSFDAMGLPGVWAIVGLHGDTCAFYQRLGSNGEFSRLVFDFETNKWAYSQEGGAK